MIIIIEGADWVGKSIVVRLLKSLLESIGYTVELHNEPSSSTDLLAQIRSLAIHNEMDEITRALLMCASRSELYKQVNQSTADFIILDRSYPSTYMYQGKSNADVRMLDAIHERILGDSDRPVLAILLTAEWDTVLVRREGQELDVIEKSFTRDSYNALTDKYRYMMRTDYEFGCVNIRPMFDHIVETDEYTPEQVSRLIEQHVMKRHMAEGAE